MGKETEIVQTNGDRNLHLDSPEWKVTDVHITGDKTVLASVKFTSPQGRLEREDIETYEVSVDVSAMLRDVENEINQIIIREK